MKIEQIEIAEQKVKELKGLSRENDDIQEFINKLKGSQFLQLRTAHGCELFLPSSNVFEFVGIELIELLEKKLSIRKEFIENKTVGDLIKGE